MKKYFGVLYNMPTDIKKLVFILVLSGKPNVWYKESEEHPISTVQVELLPRRFLSDFGS